MNILLGLTYMLLQNQGIRMKSEAFPVDQQKIVVVSQRSKGKS